MTTTPTQLPIPSEKPQDLKFNAGKIDEFSTSMGWTYTDRFGVKHYTIEGLKHLAEQAISAFGYITLDSFEDGANLTLPNQILRWKSSGEYYRWDGNFPKAVVAGSTPDSSGGIGNGKWLSVGAAALASPQDGAGDALISVKQPYIGAINQTQHDYNKIYVSITNFGASPSSSALTATDASDAITKALASGANNIYVPPGFYLLTQTIEIPEGVTLFGSGVGYDKKHPTTLLLKGTGAKTHTVSGATSISIANPDVGAAYLADSGTRGDVYKTNDFTTPFSAAVILNQHSSLVNIGVVPYFEGISGYFDINNFNLSDDWDVGIWLRNAGGARVSYCIAQGHFRKAGFLQTSTDIGVSGVVPECERCHIEFCSFEGLYGGSIRSLHTVNSDINYGFAGTDFINCYFRGFWHNTGHLATSSMLSSPLDRPSGCLEIDGAFSSTGKVRGVQFLNCTFTNRDDIMIFTDNAAEILFSGCYYESQLIKVNGALLAGSLGCRMIGTSNSQGIWHKESSQYGVDVTPYMSIDDISLISGGRYDITKSGLWNPQLAAFDDWQDVVFGGSIGKRMRNSTQLWVINAPDGTNNFSISAGGTVSYTTNINSKATGININRTVSGVVTPAFRVYGTGNMQIGGGTGASSLTVDGPIGPYADGSSNVGLNNARFGSYFGVNGSINTSDATHKTVPREISHDEILAFSKIARLPSVWQWLEKFKVEGDEARLHSGPTVQDAIKIMVDNGLDWSRYSAFCYDKWEDTPDEIDEKGRVCKAGIKAGEIYSFRKEDLLWWCLRAQVSQFDDLCSRVEALERASK